METARKLGPPVGNAPRRRRLWGTHASPARVRSRGRARLLPRSPQAAKAPSLPAPRRRSCGAPAVSRIRRPPVVWHARWPCTRATSRVARRRGTSSDGHGSRHRRVGGRVASLPAPRRRSCRVRAAAPRRRPPVAGHARRPCTRAISRAARARALAPDGHATHHRRLKQPKRRACLSLDVGRAARRPPPGNAGRPLSGTHAGPARVRPRESPGPGRWLRRARLRPLSHQAAERRARSDTATAPKPGPPPGYALRRPPAPCHVDRAGRRATSRVTGAGSGSDGHACDHPHANEGAASPPSVCGTRSALTAVVVGPGGPRCKGHDRLEARSPCRALHK
jgi:hypothetical protein